MFALALIGCTDPETPAAGIVPEAVSVEVDATVPTLVRVRWETAEAVIGGIEWVTGSDAPIAVTPETSPSTTHALDFLGIPAGESATLRILSLAEDGTEVGSGEATVELEPPPADLAAVSPVLVPDDPPTPYLIVASVVASTGLASAQVVDWRGRPLWWVPPSNNLGPFARRRPDGLGVALVSNETTWGETVSGSIANWDWGGAEGLWSAPDAHHDLLALPDGRIATAGWSIETVDGEPYAGEQLMLIGPDGPEQVLWNSFDHVPLVENFCWNLPGVANGATDAVHANGIGYDPGTDTFLLSLYCLESVVAIDGTTGAQKWAVGGELGTLTVDGDDGFNIQHAPRAVPGGFRVFDNNDWVDEGSRVRTYAVDESAGTATLTEEWQPDGAPYTNVLGESNDYGDGQLVPFGIDGTIYWHDAAGEVMGQIEVEVGAIVGSVEGLDSMPLPAPE